MYLVFGVILYSGKSLDFRIFYFFVFCGELEDLDY